jgi:hypothetical protein
MFLCTRANLPVNFMRLLRNITLGMTAGLAGSAAMHGFRLLWEHAIGRDRRHTIFGFDHESDINAARIASQLVTRSNIEERQASQIGIAMHYAFGATLGIVYTLAWRPADSYGLFGTLLWLCADEIPISASRISDPFAKSAASHASALAAHLVFGRVTAEVVRALRSGRSARDFKMSAERQNR